MRGSSKWHIGMDQPVRRTSISFKSNGTSSCRRMTQSLKARVDLISRSLSVVSLTSCSQVLTSSSPHILFCTTPICKNRNGCVLSSTNHKCYATNRLGNLDIHMTYRRTIAGVCQVGPPHHTSINVAIMHRVVRHSNFGQYLRLARSAEILEGSSLHK